MSSVYTNSGGIQRVLSGSIEATITVEGQSRNLRFNTFTNTSMTLISSISGIRGIFGAGLDATVLARNALSYGQWALERAEHLAPCIVVGRDARVSGEVCAQIVIGTLRSVGLDVIDAGLATTPTVAMGVLEARARGGIILSASHNPGEWNALKLLNEKSEFLSPTEGRQVMEAVDKPPARHGTRIGSYSQQDFLEGHVEAIAALDFLDTGVIRARRFKVLVDGINSVGGFALPRLLKRIGVRSEDIHVINGEPTGRFAHPPEPLPAHLTETMERVRTSGADLGLVVDPDADRLALIDERGVYVSEELTQVIAADFLWARQKGPFVTNLSSSSAIDDVAWRWDQPVYRSAVGEINVVKKMQEVGAILGGEGNGGVILPGLHYGRDALVGAAMVLQHLAEREQTLSELRDMLPRYYLEKHKIRLNNPEAALCELASIDLMRTEGWEMPPLSMSTLDGIKINFDDGWVHLRKSNTEPVVRVYAEAGTEERADSLAVQFLWWLEDADVG